MSFPLAPKLITLNCIMVLILRDFTEFMYDVIIKQLPQFQNLLLIVCDHVNTICAIVQGLLTQNKL